MVDYTLKTNWDCLASLMKKIEENKKSKEKVISFDGLTLTTNKFTYTLFAGELNRTKRTK
jgi:hypothetical protein